MKKVLIVVDMQKDFVDGALGTKEAVEIVDDVVKEMKKDYDKVYLTRDTHQSDYLNTQEGKNLPVEHCIENTDGWQLDKKIEKAVKHLKDYTIINKPSFGSEKLVEEVKAYDAANKIESITLVGLCTDICVVSNALLLKAALPETPMMVIEKCCAGVTPDSHKAALTTMRACQVKVI